MLDKPGFCTQCPINELTTGYVPLYIGYGSELWVGEAAGEEEAKKGEPFIGGAGAWLNSLTKAAKINRPALNVINVIGCRPPDNVFPTDQAWSHTPSGVAKAAVDHCVKHHLAPALASKTWSRVVALGAQPLKALTGRTGILNWRGSPLPLTGAGTPVVMPTLHPAYIMRNAKYFSTVVGDLRKRLILPPENYTLYANLQDLQAFKAPAVSFDFEWDYQGNISICGIGGTYYEAFVFDWVEPYISEFCRIMSEADEWIGHNIIGADMKYFEDLGLSWKTKKLTDTMLMQHLVMPDMPHSLAFTASVLTNKVFWKGRGEDQEDDSGEVQPSGAQWKTWDHPMGLSKDSGGYAGCSTSDEAFRLYNARDVDASFQCVAPLKTLLDKYEMERTYRLVSVPAAFLCRDMGERGLRVDNSKVKSIRDDLALKIAEQELLLPEGLRPYEKAITKQIPAPAGTYKPKTHKCKGSKKAGNTHDSVELTFIAPIDQRCPVCNTTVKVGKLTELKRIKVAATKRVCPWNSNDQVKLYAAGIGLAPAFNLKTGRETADKSARKRWGRTNTEFARVDLLKKSATRRNSFAKPGMLTITRAFFNLLVHGTSEGRLASSGRRRGIDPNIQNQPKDIRKIFMPEHEGWGFISADIVQGENMLTAKLAGDGERLERLRTPGFDEHSFMASLFFNKPIELVSKGGLEEYLRDPGKIINHGRNYGLGEKKTQQYLADLGYYYTIADIREMINIWKSINKRTALWQQETIETVMRQSYLCNPFGRRRWFHDRDYATKALAFLPASTLADCVLRMMIALHHDRFASEIQELGIQHAGNMPEPAYLALQVHDELCCQTPDELHTQVADLLTAVMTQPWRELDNFALGVEIKYSGPNKSWGEVKVL